MVLALLCAAVHVVSARPGFGWMWGAHFYAFFPPFVLYGATLALLVMLVLLASERTRIAERVAAYSARAVAGKRLGVLVSGATVAVTAMFWVFRICHTYLGDGNIIVREIDTKQKLLPREPLTSILQYAVYGITKPWFAAPGRKTSDVAQDAVAVGSVAAGLCFLVALWFLADELSRLRPRSESEGERRTITALLWMCLAAQGYMQIFFGYVENYSFYAVGVILFLWLCLRCLRGACALLWPGLALCLVVALHLSSAVLVLPFAVLTWALIADRMRRRGALRDVSILGVLAGATLWILLLHGINPVAAAFSMVLAAFPNSHNAGYMFSGRHCRDFLNEQILIGPLGLFLFVSALASRTGARGRLAREHVFLIVAGAAFALISWMVVDSELRYACDWDLFSHGGMVLTAAGLGLLLARPTRPATLVSCLAMAWFMSLYHTVPWIATNTDEGRSLARLEALPLGYGRTELLVAGWYNERGDTTTARLWLERSIRAYEGNPNSYYELGVMKLDQHHYEDAVWCFENTVRCRPDRLPYRLMMVRACFLAGQPERAVPHLEALRTRDPHDMTVALYLGEALFQSGHTADAVREFESVRLECRRMAESKPSDALTWATYGWVLFRVGDVDGSLSALAFAVAINPASAEAQCYLGCVLRSVGRAAEARDHFTRSLAINPDLPVEIPDRNAITAWLAGAR